MPCSRGMYSFSATHPGSLGADFEPTARKILVTGVTGNIGSYFARHAPKPYTLRLMVHDKDDAKEFEALGEVVTGEITDLEQMKAHCQGIDTVVHMAGAAAPNSTWDVLLEANIIGVYNTMVAAKAAGCRRLIFASSIHAVSGYPADVQVKTSEPVNPGDLYGVSKCFGEALSRYMAEQEGLSVIALRIGAFQPHSTARDAESVALMDAYVSHRDLHQLIVRCIEVDNIRFAIFNGLSDNRFKRLDITDARALVGYQPEDDLTDMNPRLKGLKLSDTVVSHSMTNPETESGLREDL